MHRRTSYIAITDNNMDGKQPILDQIHLIRSNTVVCGRHLLEDFPTFILIEVFGRNNLMMIS